MHLTDTLTPADEKILENSIVFKGIPLEEIQPFFHAGQVQIFYPEQAILSLGDKGRGLYIVLEGKAEVFIPHRDFNKNSKNDLKVSLELLKPGICFGEYSLVDHKDVSASVSAFTKARLFYLSTEDFYRIADAHTRVENIIYKNMLKLLISRCREANQELENDAFLIY